MFCFCDVCFLFVCLFLGGDWDGGVVEEGNGEGCNCCIAFLVC